MSESLSPSPPRPDAKLIFIISPYTGETEREREDNVLRALTTANRLIEEGFVPYVPHLGHFWNFHSYKRRDFWIAYHKIILKRCDGALLSNKNSPGTRDEELFAKENNVPVFRSIREIISAFGGNQ